MSADTNLNKEPTRRVNTRLFVSQANYIVSESKKSKGKLTHGDVHRELLAEAIAARKAKQNGNK